MSIIFVFLNYIDWIPIIDKSPFFSNIGKYLLLYYKAIYKENIPKNNISV